MDEYDDTAPVVSAPEPTEEDEVRRLMHMAGEAIDRAGKAEATVARMQATVEMLKEHAAEVVAANSGGYALGWLAASNTCIAHMTIALRGGR